MSDWKKGEICKWCELVNIEQVLNWVNIDQYWANIGKYWTNIGDIWGKIDNIGQILVNIGQD